MKVNNTQKFELTWISKDEPRENIEPRILVENPKYSYGEIETETLSNGKLWDGNMLIAIIILIINNL